ncbi:biopolymer transporter ExbD [Endozoicomonas montiporae]|uniref:Biopolymer transporter ExbD n=2 Tax=Endozoicomonas montiporae TaxID=1027273 RepID=A0A081NA19_9GAMM|nr:biopolymer transporter ExbD [Endozoicomonas montiporae]AMO57031.1 TonB-dependent biopolymer transport protein ExbD [Endozoicomonas montiporae CL-33]KEQ15292.1 biopolymer transporter ExbD [Endozoicomonas montiporae]
MKFRRQTQEEVSVNLTPLIDVVFLLLIFFMVSTTFTRETRLAIDLPEASGEVQEQVQKQIEIVIGKEGDFAVNGKSLVNSRLDTLKSALGKVSDGDGTLPLVITADANTPYQSVVTAMDAAGQLGFANLSMTTRKPADSDGE